MNQMQKDLLRRSAAAFSLMVFCLIWFFPKSKYETCIYNFRFWNLLWPSSVLVFIIYIIWLLWNDVHQHAHTKLSILYILMVLNAVAEFGFIFVWIWEYQVKKNRSCFSYFVSCVEMFFVSSFGLTFFFASVGLAVIFFSEWSKKRKLRKEGINLLTEIYSKIEKGNMTEEELKLILGTSKNKEIFDKHEILARELKHLKKFYSVKLNGD